MISPRRRRPMRVRRATFVALALAAPLLVLALPRTLAALADLPARAVLARVGLRAPVEDREIDLAIASRTRALGWIDDGVGRGGLGLLRLMAADRAGLASATGRADLARAAEAHRRALARAPAQAYVWTRLARIDFLRDGPTAALGPVLAMAVAGAPDDSALRPARLDLAFLAWRRLDAASRAALAGDIARAAATDPLALARLARRRYAIAILRDALAQRPGLRRAVDAALLTPAVRSD